MLQSLVGVGEVEAKREGRRRPDSQGLMQKGKRALLSLTFLGDPFQRKMQREKLGGRGSESKAHDDVCWACMYVESSSSCDLGFRVSPSKASRPRRLHCEHVRNYDMSMSVILTRSAFGIKRASTIFFCLNKHSEELCGADTENPKDLFWGASRRGGAAGTICGEPSLLICQPLSPLLLDMF